MTAIETDGGGTEQELPRKKLSGKKIVLFIVLPVLLLVGGGAAVYFSGILDGGHEEDGAHAEQAAEVELPAYTGPPVFKPFGEVLVNLNTPDRRTPVFLKLNMTLELSRPEDLVAIEPLLPRINDVFQVYLRELRVEDLRGSAGTHRLREELLMRVNAAVSPMKVKQVLITEFLVQ